MSAGKPPSFATMATVVLLPLESLGRAYGGFRPVCSACCPCMLLKIDVWVSQCQPANVP